MMRNSAFRRPRLKSSTIEFETIRLMASGPWDHFAIQRSLVNMSLDQSYAALADPSRRAILQCLVEQGSSTVSELAAPLSIGMPTVMKHLDVLSRAGMIARHKSGRVVTVSLAPDAMSDAMAWLEKTNSVWSARLDRLVDVVEQEQS